MKALFAVTAAVTFVASITITALVSKKVGKKEAINSLRAEQLAQTSDELRERRDNARNSNGTDFASMQEDYVAADNWYASEVEQINEMYDEIVNNL